MPQEFKRNLAHSFVRWLIETFLDLLGYAVIPVLVVLIAFGFFIFTHIPAIGLMLPTLIAVWWLLRFKKPGPIRNALRQVMFNTVVGLSLVCVTVLALN